MWPPVSPRHQATASFRFSGEATAPCIVRQLMPEDQPSLPFDAQTFLPFDTPASDVAGGPPELRDEVAAMWGLPLGERVEVTLRGAQVDALRGVLELATAPSYPWNPREPLQLRIAGFPFSSRAIERWTTL